jgi:hypothetical protein
MSDRLTDERVAEIADPGNGWPLNTYILAREVQERRAAERAGDPERERRIDFAIDRYRRSLLAMAGAGKVTDVTATMVNEQNEAVENLRRLMRSAPQPQQPAGDAEVEAQIRHIGAMSPFDETIPRLVDFVRRRARPAAPADLAALLRPIGTDNWPTPHEKHVLLRDGKLHTCTVCYGMHKPWWTLHTTDSMKAAEPVFMLPTDRHALLSDVLSLAGQGGEPERHWLRILPFKTPAGRLCPLCDSLDSACLHPQVKCSRCGKEGLQENWPFDCCGVNRHGGNDG